MPGFHVENFGCRAARADGEAVSDRLCAAGLAEQQPSDADVVIVNTCSVTAEADRAARAYIRRAHRVNPEARILVTGCYAQRAPEELAGIKGVAAVVGNSHKALAPQIALGLAQRSTERTDPRQTPQGPVSGSGHEFSRAAISASPRVSDIQLPAGSGSLPGLVSVQSILLRIDGNQAAPIWADDRFAHSFLEEAQIVPGAQTRPNLKIQEGCGNRCTFCVIPQTRGSSRSLPAAAVLKQVEGFVAAGGNELVVSGINLGRWGRDLSGSDREALSSEVRDLSPSRQRDAARMGRGGSAEDRTRWTFAGLVRKIFDQTALPRLRLSSIEPMDWDAELIGLMREFAGGRLARHAHLPLQSGSDAVLRRMHRRYRPWHYEEKVRVLVEAVGPELTLGADVMVGFPGETDAEFEETLELVRKLPFGYLHLFPFSPRPGTRGWALHAERPVPARAVEERMAVLRVLAGEKSRAHRKRFVGSEVEAITLHTPPELATAGRTAALTENFLPLELEGRLAVNRLVRVRVSGLNTDGTLVAEAVTGDPTQYRAMTMSV
jgi:threonylcarbamoyladenosine tRNA methylthiotransferase MtaB